MVAPYHPKTPKDLRLFVVMVWRHLNLPDPTEIQLNIANYLQCGPKRLVCEAFRGVGKSWLTSALVCHFLDHHPEWNILVVSASKQRSDDFSTFVMRLIKEMPCLLHLAPRSDQRDSKISFDVGPAPPAHAPSVKSAGITGQITGSRADVIVADDVEVPSNSQTQGMRDKLSEQVKEFDAIIKPGGRVIFLGTPQTEQTIYNKLVDRGYAMRIWPAQLPAADDIPYYKGRLAPIIREMVEAGHPAGTPTDPKRFHTLDLAERAISYGKQGYSLQFMLNTHLSDLDRYPLRVRDLMVMSCNPDKAPEEVVWGAEKECIVSDLINLAQDGDWFYRPIMKAERWLSYQGCVMSIDPTGRGKDELGYCVIKMLNSHLFVVACGGLQGYGIDTLNALGALAKLHMVNHIIVEDNFGDGMFTAMFKPVLAKHHPCMVEEVKHSQQKELRIIETLEPVMARHRLVFDIKVIEDDYKSIQLRTGETAMQYSLIHQLTRVTRDRGSLAHDDRLDALAIAVAYWVESMSRDLDEAKETSKQAAIDADLERFMEHAVGSQSNSPNFLKSSAR